MTKRLLQINVCSNVLSTGKIMEDIAKVAMAHGWESYVAYGREAEPSKSHEIKIGTKWDVYEHVLESRLFDNHGLASRCSTIRLVRKIKNVIKPDVIHLHNIHGYYLNYRILFNCIKAMNVKVVWTLHDSWFVTGHCTYPTFVPCDKFMTECHHCPVSQEYPASLFGDMSNRNFHFKKESFGNVHDLTLVPVSNWLGNVVRESFMKNNEIEVIHNGVDLTMFKPFAVGWDYTEIRRKYNIDSNSKVILGVASPWSKRKGLADFVSLSSSLFFQSKKYQIVLVGLNIEQIGALPERIIGIRRTDSKEELVALYNLSDVYVNPTYADNFPTTNIEAMACGTPVITYNTGGSPEAVSVETGLVVERGNIDQLSEAIVEIVGKGKNTFLNACRRRAEVYFNKDSCFLSYIKLYNRV